jgi:methionyl-tRNA formyltransferase
MLAEGAQPERIWPTGLEVVGVVTRPDKPVGRGRHTAFSPVKQFALGVGLSVMQPGSLRRPEAQEALRALGPDLIVVAAFGQILPREVLDLPLRGCLNVHASLLPRWRGAAPIQRAIEAGDAETGVTLMQMDAGLDTGAMLLVQRVPIAARETGASLHDKLAQAGGRLIVQALARAPGNGLAPVPQPEAGVSYAHKIDKQEALIDWRRPASEIERQIRAFDPFPGAASRLGAELIKLWNSEIDSELSISDKGCGTILSANPDGVRVACGSGVLRVTALQRAGGKRLAAADFLRGYPLTPGMRFAP